MLVRKDQDNPRFALPNFGANTDPVPVPDPIPAPSPTPDSAPAWVTAVQDIFLPVAYVVALGFLAVMWLAFDHPDLSGPVLAAFGVLAGWAASSLSHHQGSVTATRNILTGLRHR
jgi:hypothetical protein